jgi:hypothetical protein
MDFLDFGVSNLPPTLFTYQHEPLWKPEWGTRYRTLPVTFPTSKTPLGEVIARLPLMADGLIHLDTDPDVIDIAAYPMSIEYFSPIGTDHAVKRAHVPDIAARRADGSVLFIDYIPVNEQERRPDIQRRTRILADHVAAQYSCIYVVHDELSILAKPLFPNLQTMWKHKPTVIDPDGVRLVMQAIRRCHFPSRIADIRDRLKQQAELRTVFAELEVGGVDLTFTAIMQMCFSGELDIDMAAQFSGRTVVSARNVRGA